LPDLTIGMWVGETPADLAVGIAFGARRVGDVLKQQLMRDTRFAYFRASTNEQPGATAAAASATPQQAASSPRTAPSSASTNSNTLISEASKASPNADVAFHPSSNAAALREIEPLVRPGFAKNRSVSATIRRVVALVCLVLTQADQPVGQASCDKGAIRDGARA
jgi:hypothetical protein